jgi:hypothetical protein
LLPRCSQNLLAGRLNLSYLKTGDWSAHANGICGTLLIREVDELGRVSGIFFDDPITGWWSERARRLTFVRERRQGGAADDQAFEGYAWDEVSDNGVSRAYCLAGSYDTFGGRDGGKDRQTFGWFATHAAPYTQAPDHRARKGTEPC